MRPWPAAQAQALRWQSCWVLGRQGVKLTAFLFGLGAVLVVMAISRAFGKSGNSLVIMILAGTVISALFSAVTSMAKYVADTDDKLPQITCWLMGNFARAGAMKNVAIMGAVLLVAGGLMMAMRCRINVMAFGEEEARTMGASVKATCNVLNLCFSAPRCSPRWPCAARLPAGGGIRGHPPAHTLSIRWDMRGPRDALGTCPEALAHAGF